MVNSCRRSCCWVLQGTHCWRCKQSAVCIFTPIVTIHMILFRKYNSSTPCVSYFLLHCNWISLGRRGSSPDLESGRRSPTGNMWIAEASPRCTLSCSNRQQAGCTHTRLNRKRLLVPSAPAEVLISNGDMSDGECDTAVFMSILETSRPDKFNALR